MSRIFGIAGEGWSQERVDGALARLIPPLHHSNNFDIEQLSQPHCGLGRTFFRSYNFSSHLYQTPDQTVTCAFNGYLFEPQKLADQLDRIHRLDTKSADPAFLFAHLYPTRHDNWLKDVNGSYAFALWDRLTATLSIGADRFGMIPLYYRMLPEGFAFASEIKALLSLSSDPGTNLLALSELFTLGSPVGDHTLFNSIFRLPPATVMTFKHWRRESRRYWTFADIPTGPTPSVDEFVEESCRLFSRSVSKLADQISNPICFLSAGYDSRRILIELAKHSKPVVAYTAPTVTQPELPITTDVPVAAALCEALGVTHVASMLPDSNSYGRLHRIAQTLLDYETDSHPWILPLLADLPVASGVNFDGLGGDVLFEFNWTYPHLVSLIGNPAALAGAVEERYPDIWPHCFRIPAPTPPLADRYRDIFASLPDFADRITAFFFSNWARRKTALFAYGLLSHKIDTVCPFLDYDLVDFVFRLPPLVRRESRVSHCMLEQVRPDLVHKIPTSHDPDLLSVTDSRWSAFRTPIPQDYWRQMQASIHREAAKDICRSPELFSQLSTNARLSALANLMPVPSGMTPNKITKSSWRLPLLGLYARQNRASGSDRVASANLAAARNYIFRA